MKPKGTFTVRRIADLVKQGEGLALEFKRSTGELKEAMKTLCAFLNGTGGTVLVGVWPSGKIEGQDVSDQTLRDIAQASDRIARTANTAGRTHLPTVSPSRTLTATRSFAFSKPPA